MERRAVRPPREIRWRNAALGGLGVAVILVAACGERREAPFYEGTWVVAGHRTAGYSAMSPEEADSWVGREARFGRERAAFGQDACASPAYELTTIGEEEFTSEFRVPPESLGHAAGPIEVVEVRCADGEWTAPGGLLVRMGDGTLYTLWDGVFFELRRHG